MTEQLNNFYLNKTEPNRGCLLALRDIILEMDENITETVKYGMPCFCYKNKRFCYVWTDRKTNEPYILVVKGKHIDHPKLEAGNRARMKILRVNPNKDIPVEEIRGILKLALALYEDVK